MDINPREPVSILASGLGHGVDDFREQLSRLFMGDLIAAEKTRWRVLSP